MKMIVHRLHFVSALTLMILAIVVVPATSDSHTAVPCETMTCVEQCDNSPCSCEEATNCGVCHPGQGCSQCDEDYFKKDFSSQCTNCSSIDNCLHCADIHGCQQCAQGYIRTYDSDCGLYYCITDGCEFIEPLIIPDVIMDPMEITHSDADGVSSTITVTGGGDSASITKVRVYIGLLHTWIGDLEIYITHENSGTTVKLEDCSCSYDNMDVWFDDEGTQDTCDVCDTCSTTDCNAKSGTLIPVEALAAFNGLSPASDWTALIIDDVGGDTGTWMGWDIEIEIAN